MRCPYCQTSLPDGARACQRCDWVRAEASASPTLADSRDEMAMWLSLAVPGLGHVYKGYALLGGSILFLIGPAVLALSLAVLPATLGLSALIPAVVLVAVMYHARHLPDRRNRLLKIARAIDHRPEIDSTERHQNAA